MEQMQAGQDTLMPTLGGKNPRRAPGVPSPLPLPHTVHTTVNTLEEPGAISAVPFHRDKGSEEGHGTGAAGLSGTFLYRGQAQVHRDTGWAV